jgi:hypothetical protein
MWEAAHSPTMVQTVGLTSRRARRHHVVMAHSVAYELAARTYRVENVGFATERRLTGGDCSVL